MPAKLLLAILLVIACNAQNRTYNCGIEFQQRNCSNYNCPENITTETHVDFQYNVSFARLYVAFDTRREVIDQMSYSVFDSTNYYRFLAGQSYTESFHGFNARGTCLPLLGGDSHGRGWVVVFFCRNVVYNCLAWYGVEVSQVVENCTAGCVTGTVGDGVCHPACNNVECDYDGGDCQPRPTVTSAVQAATSNNNNYCATGCLPFLLGDGVCQNACDVPACSYDNGDCLAVNNPCVDNPCQNGGRCINDVGSQYQCNCTSDYCGENCEGETASNTNPRADSSYCTTAYNQCFSEYTSFVFCCDGATSKCIQSLSSTSAVASLHVV